MSNQSLIILVILISNKNSRRVDNQIVHRELWRGGTQYGLIIEDGLEQLIVVERLLNDNGYARYSVRVSLVPKERRLVRVV